MPLPVVQLQWALARLRCGEEDFVTVDKCKIFESVHFSDILKQKIELKVTFDPRRNQASLSHLVRCCCRRYETCVRHWTALASQPTAPKRRRLDLCSRKSADQWRRVEKLFFFFLPVFVVQRLQATVSVHKWPISISQAQYSYIHMWRSTYIYIYIYIIVNSKLCSSSSHLLHVAGWWAQEVLIVRLVSVPVVQHQVHRHLSLQTADVAVAEVVTQLMDLDTNTRVFGFMNIYFRKHYRIFLMVKFRFGSQKRLFSILFPDLFQLQQVEAQHLYGLNHLLNNKKTKHTFS